MMTRKPITNGLMVAVVAMGIVGMTAGVANAAPISIDFNSLDHNPTDTQVGEPSNPNGLLQLPGQVGAWNVLGVTSGSAPATVVTTEGPTFTFNATGTSYAAYRGGEGDALRSDLAYTTHSTDIGWTLTGLTPGASYDLILFGQAGPSNAGAFAITGHDAGNGVGAAVTLDADLDGNFTGVVAGGGTISGTFGSGPGGFNSWSGLQFEAPPTGPAVNLSSATVASNAPPGTLIGTLRMAVVNGPYTFTKTGNGNNHTAFEIPTGTNELRTTVFLDATPPFEVEIQGVGSDGNATNSFTITLNPATYSAFIASAGVTAGVPAGGEVVATLSARDSDASSITTFGIVGGRDDLFQISGNELQQKAGADPGAAATIHYVTLFADGVVDDFVIVAIEVGAPPGTVIRIR